MMPLQIDFQQSDLCPAGISCDAVMPLIQTMMASIWQQTLAPNLSQAQRLSVCIRFVDPAESRALNQSYRGRDYPTNVLSFTTNMLDEVRCLELGDLVICGACLVDEAAEQGKTVSDHFLHLVLHGILHLIGYDHEIEADAVTMESLEVAVLKEVGVQDPYEVIVDE
jgi:probable rRNA maturation factor